MTTKNLGLVQAIFVSSIQPTNTFMIWYDTINSVHKYYDVVSLTWVEFILNSATSPLSRSGSTILLLYNSTQFELVGGELSIKPGVLASVTPPFTISQITGLQTALDSKVDKVTGYSLVSDAEILRLSSVDNYTHPVTHDPSIILQDASNRFVTDVQILAWDSKQDSIGYTPYNATNPDGYITLSDLSGFMNSYTINLPSATSVADRIAGTISTDYPSGWTIEVSGTNTHDLLITHNLGKHIIDVIVYSVVGTAERKLNYNGAYSGLLSPDQNTLLIESLATITEPIVIHLIFA